MVEIFKGLLVNTETLNSSLKTIMKLLLAGMEIKLSSFAKSTYKYSLINQFLPLF